MAFNFAAVKSVGHFFAKAWKVVVNDVPPVVAAAEKAKPVVEAIEVGTLGPVAPLAVEVTDLIFAGAGEISQILVQLGPDGEKKLLDAGFDSAVIAAFKHAIGTFGSIGKLFQK
jgi:hypothetical protein